MPGTFKNADEIGSIMMSVSHSLYMGKLTEASVFKIGSGWRPFGFHIPERITGNRREEDCFEMQICRGLFEVDRSGVPWGDDPILAGEKPEGTIWIWGIAAMQYFIAIRCTVTVGTLPGESLESEYPTELEIIVMAYGGAVVDTVPNLSEERFISQLHEWLTEAESRSHTKNKAQKTALIKMEAVLERKPERPKLFVLVPNSWPHAPERYGQVKDAAQKQVGLCSRVEFERVAFDHPNAREIDRVLALYAVSSCTAIAYVDAKAGGMARAISERIQRAGAQIPFLKISVPA